MFSGLGLIISAAVVVTLMLTIGRRELLAPLVVPGRVMAARGRLARIEAACREGAARTDPETRLARIEATGQRGVILDLIQTSGESRGLRLNHCHDPETLESYEIAPGRKLIWARGVRIRPPRAELDEPLRSIGPDIVSEAGGIEIREPDGTYLRILICLDR